MITQKDLDAIHDYYHGINLTPEFESSYICGFCQGDGYDRNYNDICYVCKACDGLGIIENNESKIKNI